MAILAGLLITCGLLMRLAGRREVRNEDGKKHPGEALDAPASGFQSQFPQFRPTSQEVAKYLAQVGLVLIFAGAMILWALGVERIFR